MTDTSSVDDTVSNTAKSSGIHIFSAPSDAPRVRWRTDLMSAAFIATALVVLILVAPSSLRSFLRDATGCWRRRPDGG